MYKVKTFVVDELPTVEKMNGNFLGLQDNINTLISMQRIQHKAVLRIFNLSLITFALSAFALIITSLS